MSGAQIGERIRELREVQNYTREVFAEKAGISSKFLYEIETGKKGFFRIRYNHTFHTAALIYSVSD